MRASRDAVFAELAHELVALFRSHFHHAETGTLGEFYDDMLLPAAAEAGTHVEPGHHYEWAWLLDQYARLLGGERRRPRSPAPLPVSPRRNGPDPTGSAVLDVLNRDGTPALGHVPPVAADRGAARRMPPWRAAAWP